MKKFVKMILPLILVLVTNLAGAQQVEMADGLRAEGKIYVIVIIILIVLAGLIAYLFLLDRKLNKMEKLLRERKQTK